MVLAPFERATSLAALRAGTFDVVVVGGGITGAGVALDAASRGLRTALIERDDLASGTSSKSSKLVHGGLRYLQQGDISLVYEALAERQRLLDNAPHLVTPLPFVLPMLGKGGMVPAKVARALGAAMWAYDLTGGLRIGKRHQRLTKAEVLAHMPTLVERRVVSGYLYYDAAADDARLTLAICRTAALHHGAVVANRCGAVGLDRSPDGRIRGVEVEADGERFTVAARAVVNAAGVWADDVRSLETGDHPDSMRPAKGIHVAVPHHLLRNDVAVILPVPKDRRSVFVTRLGDLAYIGTTDTDYDGPLDDPQCTPEDVAYLLGAVNANCEVQLTTADVVGTWAGLRPLVKSASSGRTADLSRHHKVQRSDGGLVTITGGKLTTYRRMAADTVDEVVEHLLDGAAPRSRTKHVRLRGADGWDTVEAAARRRGLGAEAGRHLASRHGGEAKALLLLLDEDPTLAEPLVPGLPYLRAEAVWAVRHEMARSVDDVLTRRTRARLWARDDAAAAADDVAALIAPELGWTPAEADASVAEFRALCEHEREAADLPHVHLADIAAR